MRTAITLIGVVVLALAVSPVPRADAQEGAFSGQAAVGFRLVDVGGAERKYQEDINLDDGPRLFNLQFEIIPDAGMKKGFDRIDFDLDNLGGDPFETLRVGVRKYGAYKFDYRRTKSTYFYNDLILPADQADPEKSQGGDFHHFNFDRVRDVASLRIDVTQNARATFGFERFTKTGESTTTLDIQRDEFELDNLIDESLNTYKGAFEYSFDKVTLVFEETIRDYENSVEIFLPGFSEGENVEDDPTVLDFFFQSLPYDFMSYEHTGRALIRPMDKLDIRVAGSFQNLELDGTASEESQGIDFNDSLFTTDVTGSGEIDRDISLLDADVTYTLSDRVSIIGGVRHQNLDQEGNFTFGDVENLGRWDIQTTGVEGGAEVYVSPRVTVHGGVMYEKRDVEANHQEDADVLLEEDEETTNTGFFAGAAWRPDRMLEVTFDLEINSFDDPFTLASPTDRQRYRLRGRYRLDNGMSFSGSWLFKDYENSNSGWNADHQQVNVRVGYDRGALSLSGGYGMVGIERQIEQAVNQDNIFDIFYEIDSHFIDGRARYAASERVAVGGSFTHYQNDGSFGIDREDLRTWVEFDVGDWYLLHLGYRFVDFDETDFDFDDYDSHIGEFSVGYKWQ